MKKKVYTTPAITTESLFPGISLMEGSGLRGTDEKGKDIGLIYGKEGNEDARSNGSTFDDNYTPPSLWE